jgi:hypothetical protein
MPSACPANGGDMRRIGNPDLVSHETSHETSQTLQKGGQLIVHLYTYRIHRHLLLGPVSPPSSTAAREV